MDIDPLLGRLQWNPTTTDHGEHPVTIIATDAHGLSTEQRFRILIAKNEAPQFLSTPLTIAYLGERYTYRTHVKDGENDPLAFKLNAHPPGLKLTTAGELYFTPEEEALGEHQVELVVKDLEGLTATQSYTLQVVKRTPLVAEVTSPSPGLTLTEPLNIIGTATGPANESFNWTLTLRREIDDTEIPLASGTEDITEDTLGTLDPTTLENGNYTLILTSSTNTNATSNRTPLEITGNLKFGRFQITYNDITLPLGGIPLTINRRYDSLNTTPGHFGAGWRLALPGRVIDSAAEGEAFAPGARVYVTKANGERIGFTFAPYFAGGLFPIWKPYFKPDPGVREALSAGSPGLFRSGGKFFDFAKPYNPSGLHPLRQRHPDNLHHSRRKRPPLHHRRQQKHHHLR